MVLDILPMKNFDMSDSETELLINPAPALRTSRNKARSSRKVRFREESDDEENEQADDIDVPVFSQNRRHRTCFLWTWIKYVFW